MVGIQVESRWNLVGIQVESRWNMVGIQVESDWTRIHVDPSEFGRNGWNLVGVQVKFGWVLTDMIFLPNSDHSDHSAWIRAEYVGEGKVLVHLIPS